MSDMQIELDKAAAAKAAAKVDANLVRRAATAEAAMGKLAEAIESAQADIAGKAAWKYARSEGKAFRSFTAYLADRLSGQPIVSKAVQRDVVKLMLAHGATQREAAQAAQVSNGTVANVAGEVAGTREAPKGRSARPNGGTEAAQRDKALPVSAAVAALDALAKVKLTDGDLIALAKAFAPIADQIRKAGQAKVSAAKAAQAKAA